LPFATLELRREMLSSELIRSDVMNLCRNLYINTKARSTETPAAVPSAMAMNATLASDRASTDGFKSAMRS
jgi:hypothetical protein